MGNEQSGSGEASSLSFLQKAKGISPRVVHTNKVIVVHAGNEPNGYEPSKDEDLIKLKDIPQFYPILRGTLNLPGIKDPTDLYTKFSSRPLLALCQRFQEHLMITSEIVAAEQGALGTRIREIDYAIATLANYLSERKKSYDKFANDLQKVRDVSVQLKKISANLQELVPSAHILNLLLPESERLPLLDLSNIVVESSDKFVCEGTEEQKVVDWSQDEVTDNR